MENYRTKRLTEDEIENLGTLMASCRINMISLSQTISVGNMITIENTINRMTCMLYAIICNAMDKRNDTQELIDQAQTALQQVIIISNKLADQCEKKVETND